MLLQHCHPHQKSQLTVLKECQHRQTDAWRKLGSQSPAAAAAKESIVHQVQNKVFCKGRNIFNCWRCALQG